MVNARFCETARLGFSFVSPRHFDLSNCETNTVNYLNYKSETFEFLLVIVAWFGFLTPFILINLLA